VRRNLFELSLLRVLPLSGSVCARRYLATTLLLQHCLASLLIEVALILAVSCSEDSLHLTEKTLLVRFLQRYQGIDDFQAEVVIVRILCCLPQHLLDLLIRISFDDLLLPLDHSLVASLVLREASLLLEKDLDQPFPSLLHFLDALVHPRDVGRLE
jgi:hypothetical protein